jgi:hypothetical protein
MSCCLVHPASEFTSEDAAEQHHVGFHRHHWCVQQAGWTASLWAMPSRGPTCLRGFAEGFSSTAGMLKHPWVGRGDAATLFERCPPGSQKASRRGSRPACADPLRGDSAGVRWPPYRRGPLGRSRREATPIWMLRSPGPMEGPGGAEGRRDQVRIRADSTLAARRRVTGSRCRDVRRNRTPIRPLGRPLGFRGFGASSGACPPPVGAVTG